jgi:hypothetical protein
LGAEPYHHQISDYAATFEPIIYNEHRGELKNSVPLVDDTDIVRYNGCIPHLEMYIWSKFQDSITYW